MKLARSKDRKKMSSAVIYDRDLHGLHRIIFHLLQLTVNQRPIVLEAVTGFSLLNQCNILHLTINKKFYR